MSRTSLLITSTVGIVLAYAAWVFFQPDDALAPDVPTIPVSRSVSDVTIGLIGLEAPAGADFMAYGRKIYLEMQQADFSSHSATAKGKTGEQRLAATFPDNLECWLYRPRDEMSAEVKNNCATKAELQTVLNENAELISRYRQIQKLAFAADGESFRMQSQIYLNKLHVAEIALDLQNGNAELAYRKWADNHRHQTRMAGYQGDWVVTAVNLVNEGLSLLALDILMAHAPQLMQTHRDELQDLLKPRPNDWQRNLANILRSELRQYKQRPESAVAQHIVHEHVRENRLQNRYAAYIADYTNAVRKNPANTANALQEVHASHRAWRASDLLDPINAIAYRSLIEGQYKTGALIQSTANKEAVRRLWTIAVMQPNLLTKADVAPASLITDKDLHSPFDGSVAKWDAAKRVLFFEGEANKHAKITVPQI
jgi:hypothetical protein